MKQNYLIIVFILFFSLFQTAYAIREHEVKLIPDDGAEGDYFGLRVSISGDYALVGSPYDDDNGDGSGSAYIFHREGADWIQQEKLTANDGEAADLFGNSVSINGNYAFVGAPMDDCDDGEDSGSAYIFVRDGEDWIQQDKITADDAAQWDRFGVSVSINGNYAIVGTPQDDDSGELSGSAYIFSREPDGEDWVQQAKITANDGEAEDYFGVSVCINGVSVIVGASSDDDNGENSGSAYIFVQDGPNWIQQNKITPDDGEADDRFGGSVSLCGVNAVVGALHDDDRGENSGSAYFFLREEQDWIQQEKVTAGDGAAEDYFGYSVSLTDDWAIVGSYFDDDNGEDSGSAYIFDRENENWVPKGKVIASDGVARDRFGISVSITDDFVIVGAFGDNENGEMSGSAYTYIFVELDLINGWGNGTVNFGEFRPGEQNDIDLYIKYIKLGVESEITITDMSTHSDYFTTNFENEITFGSGDSVNVQITFSPEYVGEYCDTLTITTDNIYIGEKKVVLIGTGVEGDSVFDKLTGDIPDKFILFNPTPNPFNSTTTIRYGLPYPDQISMQVYNLSGQQITTLFEGHQQPGIHTTPLNASGLPTGLYFVQMRASEQMLIQKVMLIK